MGAKMIRYAGQPYGIGGNWNNVQLIQQALDGAAGNAI